MNWPQLLLLVVSSGAMATLLVTLWAHKRVATGLIVALSIFASVITILHWAGLGSILFVTLTVFVVGNAVRSMRPGIQPDYQRSVSWRSARYLASMQVIVAIFSAVNWTLNGTWHAVVLCIVGLQAVLSLLLFSSTIRHLRTTKTLQATTSYTDAQLPSISVLIPARNETDDLQRCLQAAIASDYPKLEIIVLDDCSQDKHTPEIIKGFAHDGVRFIAGTQPDKSWLAKNYAYQQLADAASGEYLVFCGVDLQMSKGALRELVTTMLEKQKTMISILPRNRQPADWRSLLLQPMRYAWELSLPRRLFNRPPVLSTCWIITSEALRSAGSFKATSRSITPESYLARFAARGDGYSFLRSNLVISAKPFIDQRSTAIRLRYPQLRRRLEMVWLMTAINSILLLGQLPLAIALLLRGDSGLAIVSLAAYVLSCSVYAQVTAVMYGRVSLLLPVLAPLAVAYDIWLLYISMLRYEFSEVLWKERNICLPIMRQQPTQDQES